MVQGREAGNVLSEEQMFVCSRQSVQRGRSFIFHVFMAVKPAVWVVQSTDVVRIIRGTPWSSQVEIWISLVGLQSGGLAYECPELAVHHPRVLWC